MAPNTVSDGGSLHVEQEGGMRIFCWVYEPNGVFDPSAKKVCYGKKPKYTFFGAWLGSDFVRTWLDVDVEFIEFTNDTKFVGGLLKLQEVIGVIDVRNPFNIFYVDDEMARLIRQELRKLRRFDMLDL